MLKIWSKAEHIASIRSNKRPVGVLLSKAMDIMTVYDDGNGKPLIKAWVDCSDDAMANRYVWFDASPHMLKNLIDGHIDFHTFEANPHSGHYYLVTVNENGRSTFPVAVEREQLPDSYWAKPNIKFRSDQTKDTAKIRRYFKLDSLRQLDLEEVQAETRMLQHGVFYLHITHGSGVGWGLINTSKLTTILNRVNGLYREARLDLQYTSVRTDITQSKKNAPIIEDAETNVRVFKRASFGVMLVPNEANLFSRQRINEEAGKIFELLNTVSHQGGAEKLLRTWSPFVVGAYERLLKTVIDERMTFDFSWVNSEEVVRYDISHDMAADLQQRIRAVEIVDIKQVEAKGYYTRLHTDTGWFRFEPLDGGHYEGHFEKLVKPNAKNLRFGVLYDVTIQRTTVKRADNESKPEYQILSTPAAVEQPPTSPSA